MRALADTPARWLATLTTALGLLVLSHAAGAATGDPSASLDRLERAERAAVLELYAAETSLARARERLAETERQAARFAAREQRIERDAALVRGSLVLTERRVARTLRALYVEGGRVDPIAILLGAESLDAALEGLDGLGHAVRANRRLAAQLAERRSALVVGLAEAQEARADAERARDDAAVAAAALEAAVTTRSRALAGIRSRTATARAALEARAREAQRVSAELARGSARETESGSTGDDPPVTPERGSDPAAAPTSSLPAPGSSTTMVVDAVAYHLPGRTASGLPVGVGVIAVDPTVIPLGTRVFVPGYGPAVAADVGSAIKGSIIDLWMPSTAQALAWGRRTVTITIYG